MTEIVPPNGLDTSAASGAGRGGPASEAARSGAEGPPRPNLEEVSPQSPAVVFWTQMRKSPLAIADPRISYD